MQNLLDNCPQIAICPEPYYPAPELIYEEEVYHPIEPADYKTYNLND